MWLKSILGGLVKRVELIQAIAYIHADMFSEAPVETSKDESGADEEQNKTETTAEAPPDATEGDGAAEDAEQAPAADDPPPDTAAEDEAAE